MDREYFIWTVWYIEEEMTEKVFLESSVATQKRYAVSLLRILNK